MGKFQARFKKGLDRGRAGQVPAFRRHEEGQSSQSSQVFEAQRGSAFENDSGEVLETVLVRDGH